MIESVLRRLRAEGKHAYIRKKNGYFYDGKILLIDDEHVQIDDSKIGYILIAVSEIEEVRESRVWGERV